MISILVLIISDDSNETYALNREIWKKYMNIHQNITSYFITFNDHVDKEYPYIDGNTLYFKGRESFDNIIHKTIYAFEFFKNKNYDYVLRTNLSSLWDYFEIMA